MDPSTNLAEQIRLAEAITDGEGTEMAYLRLAELVLALNGWIRMGGFLPKDWQTKGKN